MKLTQENVTRFKVPAGRAEIIVWDNSREPVRGFGLRVRSSGARTYIYQYKLGKGSKRIARRITLGTTGDLTLEQARNIARAEKVKVRSGGDPLADREASRRASLGAARAKQDAFGVFIETYLTIKQDRTRPKTYIETARYLRKLWKPLHGLTLAEISRYIVAPRLETIAAEHGAVSADRARAALSAFFTWALKSGRCEHNPVINTARAVEPDAIKRKRRLSLSEIVRLWHAVPDNEYGRIVRLLLLTGQRPNEFAWLRWSEIDLEAGWIALPGGRTKNHEPHDIPLSEPAVAILEAQPRRIDRELVFGAGEGGFSGWSKAKGALDEGVKLSEPWQLRDIRRTVVTGLGDLGVLPHVVEAVVNHVTGQAKAGVAGTYNHSKYNAEKREALDKWATYLASILWFDTLPAAPPKQRTNRRAA